METYKIEDKRNSVTYSETGYSWTQEQLNDYEESWARDHDHQPQKLGSNLVDLIN